MMKSKTTLLAVLMSAALLFVSACSGPAATPQPTATQPAVKGPTPIISEGRLEPIRYARLAFKVSGIVSEVLVKEGQAVKKGDPLIRLGDERDSNYAAAQLELASAQQALNDLQNVSGTDLAQAVIDLRDAQQDYDDAVDYLDDLKNDKKIPQKETRQVLVQTAKGYRYETRSKSFKGPAPQDWIVEAENDLALKKAKLDEAKRNYDKLKGGIDAEQLAVLEARLEAAKAGVAAFTVTAPFDGMVADLPAKLGNSINAGEPAVTVADFSYWVVNTTDLTEIDVVDLKEDQPVIITLDALPGVELNGTISSIGQTYSENQGDVVYEVTVLLDDTDPAMRWGMTAEVKFEPKQD